MPKVSRPHRLTILLSDAELDKLTAYADRKGTDKSRVLRLYIQKLKIEQPIEEC